jgi:hypothetical protein
MGWFQTQKTYRINSAANLLTLVKMFNTEIGKVVAEYHQTTERPQVEVIIKVNAEYANLIRQIQWRRS